MIPKRDPRAATSRREGGAKMRATYDWLAQVSVWWWPRFADHLWQTTLFALVILAAVFVLRRGPAQWRHSFYLLASAKFMIPAAGLVFLGQQAGIDSLSFLAADQQATFMLHRIAEPIATLSSSYDVTVYAASDAVRPDIYFALTAVWLTGSVTILLLWARRRRKFLSALGTGPTILH